MICYDVLGLLRSAINSTPGIEIRSASMIALLKNEGLPYVDRTYDLSCWQAGVLPMSHCITAESVALRVANMLLPWIAANQRRVWPNSVNN